MMYNFYPRPPRGGRRSCLMISGVAKAISIHALREEGDDLAVNPKAQNRIFLSTPSARRATNCRQHRRKGADISIHALREEGDCAAGCAPIWRI